MEIILNELKFYNDMNAQISKQTNFTTANIQTISNPTTIMNAKTKVSANHKDFSKAMKMIKAQDFYLYDTSDEWAVLFTDDKGRQWAVARDWEDGKFWNDKINEYTISKLEKIKPNGFYSYTSLEVYNNFEPLTD